MHHFCLVYGCGPFGRIKRRNLPLQDTDRDEKEEKNRYRRWFHLIVLIVFVRVVNRRDQGIMKGDLKSRKKKIVISIGVHSEQRLAGA